MYNTNMVCKNKIIFNGMKKLIIGLTLGVLLVGGQSVFANNVFNGQSGDCNPAVGIGIYPNIPRDSYGCWMATSITANPGDTINVAMYYHNNTNSALSGVTGSIVESGSGQNYTFTGTMNSSQGGSQIIGTVNLNLTSSETLTYSSTNLMKGKNAVLNTQNTQTWTNKNNASITIGSVPSGWDDYGEILVVYNVGTTQPPVQNCSISNFNGPTSINQGNSATLSWQTSNCTSGSISPNVGTIYNINSGNISVSPNSTTTYTLTAQGSNGSSDSKSITVSVNTPQPNCTISSFNANPLSITAGQSSTLSWVTNNCNSVSISPNYLGTVPSLSGSASVSPSNTTTYTLTANGTGGQQIKYVTVNVNQIVQNCHISDFTANPTSITSGGSSYLNWDTTNCTSVSVSGNNFNSNTLNGSQPVYPTYTTVYTLTAYGNGGQQTQSVTVYVNNNNNNICSISDFYASDTNIDSGDSTTLYWDTDYCTSANISSIGTVNSSGGSKIVYPNNNTNYYVLTAYGNNGSDTRSVTISVNNQNTNCSYGYYWNGYSCVANNNYYQNPSGTLTSSTNSCVISSGNSSCNIYFYWNTVNPIGTSSVTKDGGATVANGNSGSSSFAIPYNTATFRLYNNAVDLANKTVYANCVSGTTWNGSYCNSPVVTYNYTPPVQNHTTVIHQNTTTYVGTGVNSPIMLKIEDRFTMVRVGDSIDYTVTYKNTGKATIKNSILQVIVPKGITIENVSRGTYSTDTNTLSVQLEDLVKGVTNTVYLEGRIDSVPTNTDQIVTKAVIVWTNTSGTQENAIAYVLNDTGNSTGLNLGAAAIFSGMFSGGLIGFLLIILLILLIIYIVRRYLDRREDRLDRREDRMDRRVE